MQANRLAAVLLQFPETFDRSIGNRRLLTALLAHLTGLPLAIEFRHRSWATDRVFAEMEKRQIALVIPDVPSFSDLFPVINVVTHRKFFYVRFHGRNHVNWHKRGNGRLDYDYTEAELQEWIEKHLTVMIGQTQDGFIFFNNHVRGQAAKNAANLVRLIDEYGLALGKV